MNPFSRAAAAALCAVVIAACGGGTSQKDPFRPERMFAFGDEMSALTADGHHYSVNGLDANGAFDCAAIPIWTQSLAGIYGFVFAECNKANATPLATSRAVAGARTADLAGQIDAQVAAGGFSDKAITTVLIGVNDILDLYAQFPQRDEASLIADARARGEAVAQQVNRIIALGPRVILANLPDIGLSPFALNERANNADTDRAALISRLTLAFNEQLGVKILLDGRYVGLAQIDQRSQVISRSPGAFGYVNVSTAACNAAPPACTTGTLVTDANATTWLWASDRWFSYAGHAQLASLAIDRAQRNPF